MNFNIFLYKGKQKKPLGFGGFVCFGFFSSIPPAGAVIHHGSDSRSLRFSIVSKICQEGFLY